MKLFDFVEEQCLIRKIEKIHDEIFSHPAKRYVFLLGKTIDVTGGTIFPAYFFMNERFDKEVLCAESLDEPKFGDRVTYLVLEKHEHAKNDVCLVDGKIIITCGFLYFRQMIQLYRETLESYEIKKHKNITITQLQSLDFLTEELK